ncbi:PDR/VanB family oxidoreductase [Candidimonas nitroreducens]|uniref:Phthalate 4,5-dioxygenase n=1 Tax=Candidimonas nitroreducens TaxID=683354 RepID=A0A225M3K2_9BURK|nr:PDR/VanB family oxidoreductase [Candidimonas nitroreducens]OWT54823.1 phthalate 4,5-dioxygenase [Candidimonas nitroreducens]
MLELDEIAGARSGSGVAAPLALRIAKKDQIASGIYAFELVAEGAEPLPAFTPGAHIRVLAPSGEWRKYSLCNAPADAGHYVITVKRDEQGRGGSVSLVDQTVAGQILPAQAPDNAFALVEDPGSLILIAGGIGITPILSMIRSLGEDSAIPWSLYYLTCDEQGTAYRDLLSAPPYGPHVTLHHSLANHDRYDLWPVLEKPNKGHVYCCGPRSLMKDVRDMSGHWSSSRVHFESFIEGGERKPDDTAFTVALARSGRSLEVPVGKTILEVLHAAGVPVPCSCESGTCGTCRTHMLEGVADHRDMVLMPEEKDDQIMVCVSRARSDKLVLDL